jgi:agmatine deiminase
MGVLTTPQRDGFWMPAEWEAHAGCWMIWPERPDNWRDGAVHAQRAFAQVAQAIARFEPVTMVVSAAQAAKAAQVCGPQVRLLTAPSDDAWMRDVGPTFVVNGAGEVRGVDWVFNAWGGLDGGLYAPWDNDDALAAQVCTWAGVARYRADFVLEGGAIHVDGQGTCLTTRQCLLNPNRNPNTTVSEMEARLRDYLGVSKVIWLDEGVYLDETDGHIDNLACFVCPGEVLLTWTDDPSDPQYRISRAAYAALADAVDAQGRRLTVHTIHQPGPLTITADEAAGIQAVVGTHPRPAGARMAASYVNFYLANGAVIVPLFADPYDEPALNTLRRLFPDRQVVGLPVGREILLGGGNIHCITQQQPAG